MKLNYYTKKVIYVVGIVTMFIPYLSGINWLSNYLIPIGFLISVFSIFIETDSRPENNEDLLDNEFIDYETD